MLVCLYTHALTKASNTSLTQAWAEPRAGMETPLALVTELAGCRDARTHNESRVIWLWHYGRCGWDTSCCGAVLCTVAGLVEPSPQPGPQKSVPRRCPGMGLWRSDRLGRERCTEAMCLHVSDLQLWAGGGQRALPNSQAPS